jgi:hypothetical protein
MTRPVVRIAMLCAVVGLVLTLTPTTSNAGSDPYRRWISPKGRTCSTTVSGVEVHISDQDVEFNNLPADAEFTINYIRNGVTTVDGPYPVEQTSGTKSYGAFVQGFPSYPFTFEFRLDTIIGGEVVYTSTLDLGCTADIEDEVSAINEVPPPTTVTTPTTGPTSSSTPSSTSTSSSSSVGSAAGGRATPRFTG